MHRRNRFCSCEKQCDNCRRHNEDDFFPFSRSGGCNKGDYDSKCKGREYKPGRIAQFASPPGRPQGLKYVIVDDKNDDAED
jgi:hypothetical protein